MQESPDRAAKQDTQEKKRIADEDRGGLVWKNRYIDQADKLAATEAQLAETKLAAEASKARRARAEAELKAARQQTRALLDKSSTDDALIQAFTAERSQTAAGCAGCCGL